MKGAAVSTLAPMPLNSSNVRAASLAPATAKRTACEPSMTVCIDSGGAMVVFGRLSLEPASAARHHIGARRRAQWRVAA